MNFFRFDVKIGKLLGQCGSQQFRQDASFPSSILRIAICMLRYATFLRKKILNKPSAKHVSMHVISDCPVPGQTLLSKLFKKYHCPGLSGNFIMRKRHFRHSKKTGKRSPKHVSVHVVSTCPVPGQIFLSGLFKRFHGPGLSGNFIMRKRHFHHSKKKPDKPS